MRIGLITYQTGHHKTLEITLKLLTRGHTVTWYAFPFKHREPKPNAPYADRPAQLLDYDVEAFCKRYSVGLVNVHGWTDDYADRLGEQDIYLTCIAKIIPASFIAGRTILNAHPGLLPRNRGVDAFKWSIVNGWPVGVTLHAIDHEIDRGTILYRRIVPIMETDTLPVLCQRMYDFECDMLANFDAHLHNLGRHWLVGDNYPVSHKHIPEHVDAEIETLFLSRKKILMDAAHRSSWDMPVDFAA